MRYLSTADTLMAMPTLDEQLSLAEAALISVETGGEVPGKSAVHPRAQSSIAYAMPASLVQSIAGLPPVLGLKWVTVFPDNPVRGRPAVEGLVVLNDGETGVPSAILDASSITAARTAAVSGVAISRLLPAVSKPRAAVIGVGVQGSKHIPMLAHIAPGLTLVLFDSDLERARVAGTEARSLPGIGQVEVTDTARKAVGSADVIVTAASFGPIRQMLEPDWLVPEATVISVDYEMYASAALARTAASFLIDERGGFENARREGRFQGFPDPGATLGGFLLTGAARPPGRVLVVHLGMGLTDLVFASAILIRAAELGIGTVLPTD